MSTCIFIFTRDLRIEDNTGLNYAATNYKKLIPLFIFTGSQVGKANTYRSERSIDFMKASLICLNKKLLGKLNIIKSDNVYVTPALKDIVKNENVKGIVINKDYTPYARKRENILETYCKDNLLEFKCVEDYLLNSSFILNNKGEHYKKFTPFFNIVIKNNVREPFTNPSILNKIVKIKSVSTLALKSNVTLQDVKDILNSRNNYVKNYNKQREVVNIDGTRISVYLKFGIVSIRQVYKAVKSNKDFIRSLIWRDFYYTYYYFSPKALYHGDQYKENFKWRIDTKGFEAWKNGKTGFPIVDAGMRQMNETGYMHNRVRMVVASFLAKTLIIDWKAGEKYFSNKLLDIDWLINTGNWQNVVSVAKHSQPYFRVFNPWVQSKKYDKECEYIKKWIPELKSVPNEAIHTWENSYVNFPGIYIKPIVNYNETKKEYILRRE